MFVRKICGGSTRPRKGPEALGLWLLQLRISGLGWRRPGMREDIVGLTGTPTQMECKPRPPKT